MSEMFAFDSAGYDPEDAFARYCDLYAMGADVERTADPFFARVRSWRMDRMLLFDREYGGVRHRRGERVARDGFDHFVLHQVVSGEFVGGPHGAAVPIAPGETLLLDTCEANGTVYILTAPISGISNPPAFATPVIYSLTGSTLSFGL